MQRRAKQGITIVDIGRRLGLSAMTVSRALTGSTEVSQATRARVLSAARKWNYQPNRWARSLVTRRSSMIGVVIPDISHSFFAEITAGIEEAMERSGYDLLLCHSRGDAARERSEVQMLVASRVDGLIVASVQPENSPGLFAGLRKQNVPFVLIDRFFPGRRFRAALVDDRAVGRLATEHLIGLGHRRIAHVSGPRLSPGSLRLEGYREAMRRHRLPAPAHWIAAGDFGIESGRAAMHRFLQRHPRPTAVFAANDPMAIGVLNACREAGLRVPADISVVGAGNIEGIHHPNPFLTTIDWPRTELGRAAAELLLEQIADPGSARADVRQFAPRLLARQSTIESRANATA